jgi:ABC-type transport system substrate-binding protein
MTYSKKHFALMLSFVMLSTLALLPPNVVAAQDDDYLFKVTLIAPGNANMLRRQWGQIIANSFRELGIDARVVYLGWTGCFDRALAPPLDIRGLTWDEGGFDIQLVGYTPGIVPNPAQLFYGMESSWAPFGGNYYLYNNTVMNNLCEIYLTTTNATEREEAALAIQPILYAELPHSKIVAQATPAVINPDLGGPAFSDSPGGPGWLYFNVEPRAELITGKTEVVYAQTGEIEALIPPLSYSWYDITIYTHIFSGLVTTSQDFSNTTIPELLTNWEVSEGGFKWTFTCRSGVTWHDGEPFTADDVVFSLWANLNTSTGSQHAGDYAIAMGDNIKFTTVESCDLWDGTTTTVGDGTKVGNVTAVDATTVEMWLPELLAGKPYAFWDPYLLGFDHNIIPKHIMENVPLGEWEDSVFNTGEGSVEIDGTTYTGPVGTGPYKWVDFDPVAQIVHLEKNDQYWNTTALEADSLFEVEDYYVRFIVDKTSALAALKNEQVDILDPQYQMQADVATIGDWGKVLLNTGTGDQEIGYNGLHPVFGTGVDTPLGQSDPSRAAEAANYVRMAFDYAIPRQLIIDNLLDGFGAPLGVHWQPWQLYANTSITARPYDLVKAAEYLALAGYDIPVPTPPEVTSIVGDSLPIIGVHTDPSTGGISPERDLELRITTDNETFTTIGFATTDFAGRYFFTVTATEAGTYYIWTFDRLYSAVDEIYKGTYLQSWEVQTFANALSDGVAPINTEVADLSSQVAGLTNIAYIGVIIAVVAIALAFILRRT